MSLGIVIPAFNAARTLPAVIARIPAGCWQEIEVVAIVDDGSRDDTASVATALIDTHPKIELVKAPFNGGYGAAMKLGLALMLKRSVDVVACIHADGQYAPELLPTLLAERRSRSLDLLQGSRIASGTARSGGMPIYKIVAGRLLTVLENGVFGLALTDYHSGYLIYGRRALETIPFVRLSNSFDFDLEVIASARAQGLRIGESPIPTHYGDEVSYLQPIPYGLRVLRVLGRYLRGAYD
jgi:glycosyltransferase involved in cell wall biosynthesis